MIENDSSFQGLVNMLTSKDKEESATVCDIISLSYFVL